MYNSYKILQKFKKFLLAVNKTPSTIRNYSSDINHFLKWVMAKYKINENEIEMRLSELEMKSYLFFLKKSNVNQQQIRRKISSISAFTQFLNKELGLSVNFNKNITLADLDKRLIIGNNIKEQNEPLTTNFNSKSSAKSFFILTFILTIAFLISFFTLSKTFNKPLLPLQERPLYISGLANAQINGQKSLFLQVFNNSLSTEPIYESQCNSLFENGKFTIYLNECALNFPAKLETDTLFIRIKFTPPEPFSNLIPVKLNNNLAYEPQLNQGENGAIISSGNSKNEALQKADFSYEVDYQSIDIIDNYALVAPSKGLLRPASIELYPIGIVQRTLPQNLRNDYIKYTVRLKGESPVLITNLNGEPQIGDYLGPSSIDGYAQITNSGFTIGRVLEINPDLLKNQNCPEPIRGTYNQSGEVIRCGMATIAIEASFL